MSNFPSVSQQYNPADVEELLEDFRQELRDEKELAKKLEESTSEEKLADAQKFLNDNKARIANQHAEMLSIRDELDSLVEKNKRRVATDQAYQELVNGDDYKNVAKQLAEIKAVAKALDSHLKSAGVRGRVPGSDSSTSSSTSNTSSSSTSGDDVAGDDGERSKGARRSKKAGKSEQ
jgi:hypothetical protein